jgi:hypothetical protein
MPLLNPLLSLVELNGIELGWESVRYDRVDSDSIPTVGLSIRPLSRLGSY